MTWTLRHCDRPWTTNAERRMHYHQRGKLVSQWQQAFATLAKFNNVPTLNAAEFTFQVERKNRKSMCDLDACQPAAKAAIDGVVKAGVLTDDNPTYVKRITYLPPVVTGTDALVMTIEATN